MKSLGQACVLALLALACSAPAFAAKGDKTIRLGYTVFQPTGTYVTSTTTETGDAENGTTVIDGIDVDGSESSGFFIAGEYGISDILGLEIAVARSEFDIEGNTTRYELVRINGEPAQGYPIETESRIEGTLEVIPVMVALNIHYRFGRGDIFIAPVLGYVLYNGFELGTIGNEIDDDTFAYGWNAGFEYGINKSRSLRASFTVRYLKTFAKVNVEGFADDALNVDPFLINFGLAYGF